MPPMSRTVPPTRKADAISVRSIKVSTEMNAYLTAWPHTAQVAQLRRTVTVRSTGKTSREVVYLLTTLPPELASPQRLLELVRGHWGIENALHYVRDVICASRWKAPKR
jgi:predicted transposase YbfD/YdcC